jgi:hypothetical protein
MTAVQALKRLNRFWRECMDKLGYTDTQVDETDFYRLLELVSINTQEEEKKTMSMEEFFKTF